MAAKENDFDLARSLLSAGHNPYERTTAEVKKKKRSGMLAGKQRFPINSTAVEVAKLAGHLDMLQLLTSSVRGGKWDGGCWNQTAWMDCWVDLWLRFYCCTGVDGMHVH
ncbi:MAG: hypothetical protein MI674_00465 [Cytophagales bacterium]|nr:hypothetical protein [Cytophagales bacterium]